MRPAQTDDVQQTTFSRRRAAGTMQDGNGQRKTSSENRAAAAVTQNVHQTRRMERNALMHRDNVRHTTCSGQRAADDIAADEP
jgi:hypothetical protein